MTCVPGVCLSVGLQRRLCRKFCSDFYESSTTVWG